MARAFEFDLRTQVRGNFDSANTLKTGGDGDQMKGNDGRR